MKKNALFRSEPNASTSGRELSENSHTHTHGGGTSATESLPVKQLAAHWEVGTGTTRPHYCVNSPTGTRFMYKVFSSVATTCRHHRQPILHTAVEALWSLSEGRCRKQLHAAFERKERQGRRVRFMNCFYSSDGSNTRQDTSAFASDPQ